MLLNRTRDNINRIFKRAKRWTRGPAMHVETRCEAFLTGIARSESDFC